MTIIIDDMIESANLKIKFHEFYYNMVLQPDPSKLISKVDIYLGPLDSFQNVYAKVF